MVTKAEVLEVLGQERECDFDIFMTQYEPIIIKNTIHYPDEAVLRFMKIYGKHMENR